MLTLIRRGLTTVLLTLVSLAAFGAAPTFVAADTQSTTGNVDIVLTKPSGTVQDHYMVVGIATAALGVSYTAPAGWSLLATKIETNASDEKTLFVYGKLAGGSEGADYTFTPSGGWHSRAFIATYSGVNTANPVNVIGSSLDNAATASPSTITAPSITTTVADTMLLYVATVDVTADGTQSYTAPGGYTERVDTSSTARVSITMGEKVQASAGASGIAGISVTHSGNAGKLVYHLALAGISSGGNTGIILKRRRH